MIDYFHDFNHVR